MKFFKKPTTASGDTGEAPALSRWGNWRTWTNIFFLFFTLEIAVFSIEQAKWITPQPSLTLVLLISVVFIYLLTAARLPGWLAHITAVLAGILVTFWQGAAVLPGGGGFAQLINVTASWLQGAAFQQGEERAIFGAMLVLLIWLTGYLSTRFILKRYNAWVGVSLGLVILLVNISNLPAQYYIFFIVYLMVAVLLVIQTNIVKQHNTVRNVSGYSGKSLFYLVVSTLCITGLAVTLSWATPQVRVPALQDAIAAHMPWTYDVRESGFNILNSVPSKKASSTAAQLQDMNFGKNWHTSDEVQYIVESDQPAYWQVIIYDSYNGTTWESNADIQQLKEKKTEWERSQGNGTREKLKYKVTTNINTDTLVLTGDFESAEMPVVASYGTDDKVTELRSPRVLTAGESYTVRTYIANASEKELEAVSANYSDVIKSTYLQLPATLPKKIKLLSENVTANMTTPYDKVIAIDSYLSRFPYTLEVEALPEGEDAVADFLFTQKKGFCMHFSSAMTIMLRSLGVPARLAVGYLPGDPGEKPGEYLLRDKHYHAWTQVYFPGYGWINFEPTPSSSTNPVLLDVPLISTHDLSQNAIWNSWYIQAVAEKSTPNAAMKKAEETPEPYNSAASYADELGIIVLVVLGAALLYGILYSLARFISRLYSGWLWQIDRNSPALSVYTNLHRLAAMENITSGPQQTPLEFYARIVELMPEQSNDLDYIVKSYLERRFGPVKDKPTLYDEAEILKARVRVYDAMLRRKGFIGKLMGRG